MKTLKELLLFLSLALQTVGCHEDATTSLEAFRTTVQTDTIPYNQLPSRFDSLTLYVNNEVGWGLQLNISRADSLANWFAQSGIQIMDMWFPISDPVCARTVITYNEVYVRINRPDYALVALGFTDTDGVDNCFFRWKHYRFVRTSIN